MINDLIRTPILFFIVIPFFFAFSGCSNYMSLQEARKLAGQYEDQDLEPGERGLGKQLQAYVDIYGKKPWESFNPSKPGRIWDDEALGKVSQRTDYIDVLNLSRWGLREYYNGKLDSAISIMRKADNTIRITWMSSINAANLARVYAAVGDVEVADQFLAKAISLHSSVTRYHRKSYSWHPQNDNYAIFLAQGDIALASGEIAAAEYYYQQALDLKRKGYGSLGHSTISSAYGYAAAFRGLARTSLLLGRTDRAESWARQAFLNYTWVERPWGFALLADVFLGQGRLNHAEQMAEISVKNVMELNYPSDSYIMGLARETLARVYMAENKWEQALRQYQQVERDFGADIPTRNKILEYEGNAGLAYLMSGKPQKAVEKLDYAYSYSADRFGDKHPSTNLVLGLKAVALLKTGNHSEAMILMNDSIPALLENWRKRRGQLDGISGRALKMRLIIEAYFDLLQKTGSGNMAKSDEFARSAFKAAALFQTKSVHKALASFSARAASGQGTLAEMIRQRQDLDIKIIALNQRLSSLQKNIAKDGSMVETTEKIRAESRKLETALSVLDNEVKSKFPRYAAILNPEALSVQLVRERMTPDEAVLSFFVGREKTFVWAFGKQGPVSFHSVPVGREELQHSVSRLRKALEPDYVRTLADIPEFDLNEAYALYEKLLLPVKERWEQAENLLVVAEGPLSQIPFYVFPTSKATTGPDDSGLFSGYRSVPWLGKTHTVTMLPSAATLMNLRALPEVQTGRKPYAGFGDPWFNEEQAAMGMAEQSMASRGAWRAKPKTRNINSARISILPRLPETADEVRSIAKALGADPGADTFIGLTASEKNVKAMDLSDRKVLVFATHGLVPGDLDGLTQPALALSSPLVADDEENDGLLTMGEVMGLKLNADWVVLSACNTAAGDGRGSEAVSGLGQAFFYAGARSLLVTSWPVETTSAKLLTTTLFGLQKEIPGLSRAKALQEAMIKVMNQNGNGFSYAHPIFWAPFILVGEGN